MSVEDFCKEMASIIFEKGYRLKEAAMQTILNNHLTWEEFIALFPDNRLLSEKEFKEHKKQ